eukprot:Platyproteum_vivax@DN1942_c0_g1_i1.p1
MQNIVDPGFLKASEMVYWDLAVVVVYQAVTPHLQTNQSYAISRMTEVSVVPLSYPTVIAFLWHLYRCFEFPVQCLAGAMHYLRRLTNVHPPTGPKIGEIRKVTLTERNWRPILLTCLVLSIKMECDIHPNNKIMAKTSQLITLREMNLLERVLLTKLSYDLKLPNYVTQPLYDLVAPGSLWQPPSLTKHVRVSNKRSRGSSSSLDED